MFQAVAQVNNIGSESENPSPNIKKRHHLPDKDTNNQGNDKNIDTQKNSPGMPSPLQFMKQLKNRVLQEVKSTNSSENPSKLTPTPSKKKTVASLPTTKLLSSTLTPYPLPDDLQSCSLVGKKDASSAITRAKTQECKDLIKNITCLQQGGRLYDLDIMNLCPIGRDPGRGFQKISYDQGTGPDVRVVYLMSIHGRAYRQVKRLFKAVYHTDHYFYIHVDSVSLIDYYCCVIMSTEGEKERERRDRGVKGRKRERRGGERERGGGEREREREGERERERGRERKVSKPVICAVVTLIIALIGVLVCNKPSNVHWCQECGTIEWYLSELFPNYNTSNAYWTNCFSLCN